MTGLKDTSRRMKTEKFLGPNEIPFEAWKCLGDVGVCWLKNLFNKISSVNKLLGGEAP